MVNSTTNHAETVAEEVADASLPVSQPSVVAALLRKDARHALIAPSAARVAVKPFTPRGGGLTRRGRYIG